jgi:hypothetical protein
LQGHHHGTVTLSGTVPTFADKLAAEQVARRVAGVQAVAEEIKVKPVGKHQRSVTEIAETAARKFPERASRTGA